MADIRIPDEALPDLALLASHAQQLGALREASNALETRTSMSALRKEFAQKAGLTPQDAAKVIRSLMSLLHLCDQRGIAPAEVVSDLTNELENHSSDDWRAENLGTWRAAVPSIIAALSPDGPLAIIHKTIELTTAHQNVMESAEILTDVRPVFDASASRILRAVVTHILVLGFEDGTEESRTAYYALDTADVKKLQAACERALKKVATIKRSVATLPWPTEIAGDVE